MRVLLIPIKCLCLSYGIIEGISILPNFPYTNDETGLDDFDQPIIPEPDGLYDIVRFFRDPDKDEIVIQDSVTLEEAQIHCNREDTHGDGWFDGYRDHVHRS
jgi:hypothetical protein